MTARRAGRPVGDPFFIQWGQKLRLIRGIILKAIPALAALTAAGAAEAQTPPADIPQVISPLTVEPDHNGVNLADGKIEVGMPTLSVPGAPHLRFDRIQNAAPYFSGNVSDQGPEPGYDRRSYSVHTGTGSSESFHCEDFDCTSVTGTGSIFIANVNRFTQAGTGAVYHFNYQEVHTQAPHQTMMYYGSSVDYPNGETITYAYDTATLTGDPIPGRLFYRPNAIVSNLGYTISITYQGSDFNGDTTAWSTPQVVTLYATANPGTPLGRLTYSGDSITDLGGRVYHCTGCTNTMGADLEAAAGSTQLPGEGANSTQISPVSGANVIGSVTRDGVGWTYSYDNLRFEAVSNSYLYDHLTVNGPNGFHQVYDMAAYVISPGSPPAVPPSHRNFITRVTDSINRSTSYAYDEGFRPVTVTYPEGNSVSVGYDAYGNINWRTSHAKAGSGLADVTETRSFPTDTCGSSGYPVLCYRPTWTRDGLNRQTDFVYNNNGQMTEQIEPADANGVRRRTTIVYDTSTGFSRPSSMRVCADTGVSCGTSAPIQTNYGYPVMGNPLLPTSVNQYDPATGTTLTTTYAYDASGNLISTDGPLTGSDDATYTHYDVYGRKDWEIGAAATPGGIRLARHFFYRDADDKPWRVDAGTVTSPTTYDLTLQTRTDTTYDSRRYAIREAVSDGTTTFRVTDKANDDQGRVICTAIRMNPSSWSAMPGACALTTAGNDGPDRITLNSYDAAGQLLQETRAYGTSLRQNYATYTYSPNGKRTSVTDANGNRAEMTYDGFDRQLRWIFPSPATAGVANQSDYEEYGYDAAGNRTSLRKRDGSTLTFQFDNLNRMIVKVVPERSGLSATHTRDVYYGYDLRNAQTYARFDSSTGDGVTNVYDGFGRQTSSTLAMDGVSRMISSPLYDPAGNRIQITHPDGQAFTYTYDTRSRLVGLYEGVGTATLLDQFGYNAQGLPASRSERYGSNVTYGYDTIGRLNSLADAFAGSTGNVSRGFAFNPASQITSRTRDNDSYAWNGAYNVSRGYSVNGLNQYTAAGGVGFGYDANGNLTSDGANTYVYDVENRLVTTSGAHNATLRYDPLGRLYEISGASGVTRFLYDGDALVGEYNSAGTMTARYVHGTNAAADDPLLSYDGASIAGTLHWLHADHQGSIVAVTGAGVGTVGTINTYDEWGIPGASNIGRFQYTGQAWLSELGMYYYKARIYSPTLGRFMQTDPVGYDGGINIYEYVGDDPVNATDPQGTCIHRDSGNECVVTNRAGEAGRTAADHLQTQVRNVDHAIRGLDPKQKIRVNIGGGHTRQMTGRQIQQAWARTDWIVDDNVGADGVGHNFSNGYGAQIDSHGVFTGRPGYLESYRTVARDPANHRDEDEATRSVILHDFSHSTRMGAQISRLYPGAPGHYNEAGEIATSRLGRAIGEAGGVTFSCQTFITGC